MSLGLRGHWHRVPGVGRTSLHISVHSLCYAHGIIGQSSCCQTQASAGSVCDPMELHDTAGELH